MAPTAAAPATKKEAPAPIQSKVEAKVLHEEVSDTPLETQVTLKVSVPRDTTREQIDAYLRSLYSEQIGRKGFKSRDTPNAVYAYVFYKGIDWENDPTSWVAAIMKAATDEEPNYRNNALTGDIVGQVKKALGNDKVKLDGDTLLVEYELGGALLEKGASPQEVSDSLMFSLFFIAGTVYSNVPKSEKVRASFSFHDDPIGEVSFTRESWEKWQFDAAMERVAKVEDAAVDLSLKDKITPDEREARVQKAKRAEYRKLLAKLPGEAVDLPKQYRP